MKKIIEHTYGTHIYMKLELNNNIYEVDCYIRENGNEYKTTADGTAERQAVINAFNELY